MKGIDDAGFGVVILTLAGALDRHCPPLPGLDPYRTLS